MNTRVKLFWVAVLYYSQGFPAGLIKSFMPVCLAFFAIREDKIGDVIATVGLAWTLKFLWAPVVDAWGRRRRWIRVCQAALGAACVGLVFVDHTQLGPALWGLLGISAFLSATKDIAIDAYSIELLERREMGIANGVRVMAFRIALIVSGGLLLVVAGRWGWPRAFLLAGGVFFALAAICSWAPDPERGSRGVRSAGAFMTEHVWNPLKLFFRQPGFAVIMIFILLFKFGDLTLSPMTGPFWKTKHFSAGDIGQAVGIVGVFANVGGALLGGWLTTRWGIFTALWTLGLAQAVSNLAYVAAAQMATHVSVLYVTSSIELFCGGLGTAPFLAFLMSICNRHHAATQYALLSALYGLSGTLAAAVSGRGVIWLGYADYFLLTFLLALPAFALLPWVKRWIASTSTSPENVDITGS